MHRIFYSFLCCLLAACSKETPANNNNPVNNQPVKTKPVSQVTFFINGAQIDVTSIDYNRSNSTFNFAAQNAYRKIDVRCFWFIQYGRYSYQYSDSINYSYRSDSLKEWTTVRAADYGNVSFNCCTAAPLTDSLISGSYDGFFPDGNKKTKIRGSFSLMFK